MSAPPALPPQSQAVLIGVSRYDHVDFPPIQPALNSLKAMESLLTDPALGRWPRDRVEPIDNPPEWTDLALRFKALARKTTGVLLLYYVGHGVIAPNGTLCLTVRSTRPDEPRITGLSWEHVAEAFTASPARMKIAILDCCFAGRAIASLSANHVGPLDVKGVYTLTATSANRTAHTPADGGDSVCTSFTATLRDLVREGIPGGRRDLTFADLYPLLEARLKQNGLPLPDQCNTATAAHFPFARNRAVAQPHPIADDPDEEPDDGDAVRAAHIARLLDQALKIASDLRAHEHGASRAEPSAHELIAPLVVAADPEQTEPVLEGLPRRNLPDTNAITLAAMSAALAGIDGDRAEHLAATAESQLAEGLGRHPSGADKATVAGLLLDHDPDRAMRLVDRLVRTGRAADEEPTRRRAEALAAASRVLAAVDLDRSATLASEAEALYLADPYLPIETQTQVLQAVAITNPGHAENLAGATFLDFAALVAGVDQLAVFTRRFPNDALAVAQYVRASPFLPAVLARVAGALPASEASRARHLLEDAQLAVARIDDPETKILAAAEVIPVLARFRPEAARQLYREYRGAVAEIRDPKARAGALSAYLTALAGIAGGMADDDLEGAIRLARSIPDLRARALALASVAKRLAVSGRRSADGGRANAEREDERPW